MDISFCKECHNMLYPKEDQDQKVLFMSCRNCEHFEEARSNIISHIKISAQSRESTLSAMSKYLVTDKTLARTNAVVCPQCSQSEAVYFQTKDKQEEVALTIYFVCIYCEKMWSSNKMY